MVHFSCDYPVAWWVQWSNDRDNCWRWWCCRDEWRLWWQPSSQWWDFNHVLTSNNPAAERRDACMDSEREWMPAEQWSIQATAGKINLDLLASILHKSIDFMPGWFSHSHCLSRPGEEWPVIFTQPLMDTLHGRLETSTLLQVSSSILQMQPLKISTILFMRNDH